MCKHYLVNNAPPPPQFYNVVKVTGGPDLKLIILLRIPLYLIRSPIGVRNREVPL